MISVAHIAPGTEIAVTGRWATMLSWIGERWTLRIPLTVGHVYGHSPLSDSEALENGGANGVAEVVIRSASGRVSLASGDLTDGRAQVPVNRSIDIEVASAGASPLNGVGADSRAIALKIVPLPAGRDTLDLAILVDRSGSMGELCGHREPNATKHDAVIAGLKIFAPHLRKGDAAEIWEFDDAVTRVGSTRDEHPHWRIASHDWRPDAMFEQLLRGLRGPAGGTELGGALAHVLYRSPARDVLLITDGKSYALHVQSLARYGRRIAVVLVGEDSATRAASLVRLSFTLRLASRHTSRNCLGVARAIGPHQRSPRRSCRSRAISASRRCCSMCPEAGADSPRATCRRYRVSMFNNACRVKVLPSRSLWASTSISATVMSVSIHSAASSCSSSGMRPARQSLWNASGLISV